LKKKYLTNKCGSVCGIKININEKLDWSLKLARSHGGISVGPFSFILLTEPIDEHGPDPSGDEPYQTEE